VKKDTSKQKQTTQIEPEFANTALTTVLTLPSRRKSALGRHPALRPPITRVQTLRYVPQKNPVGFFGYTGYTHLKKPTPKKPTLLL